ncbi:MAG TPA: fatty acid cis/trans isomerase, partial [Pseudomonas sp.]|nr:fatty acid cis/trans isomerase [Pseudomonas sp.]
VLGNYPNFMLNLKAAEVPGFVDAMEQVQPSGGLKGLLEEVQQKEDDSGFQAIAARWGVRRSHPQFWFYFNDLTDYLRQSDPIEAGRLDMSRFENR